MSLEDLIEARASFPVLIHPRYVVKLVPHRWQPKFEAERAMLLAAQGKLPVATPEIVFEGNLDAWSYVVMTRLPGRTARSVFETVSDDARRGIVRAVGAVIARLHDLPSDGLDALVVDWPRFVQDQIATCIERHARGGAAPAWTAAIGERLLGVASELASPVHLVPMHADVHVDHVLLDEDLSLTGLLDFGDALIGDAAYDFVTPAAFFVRGRADLLAAFFEGYGCALTPELRRRCAAYQLLHRFSQLQRDVDMLLPAQAPTSLDEALDALWPFRAP